MENKRLTDEEILKLDRILVKDNQQIVALHFRSGYYGRGGSNNSPFTDEVNTVRKLEDLAGQPLYKIFGVQICAIANDVVYLTRENRANGEILSFDAKGQYDNEYGVAYDTVMCCVIRPILKQ